MSEPDKQQTSAPESEQTTQQGEELAAYEKLRQYLGTALGEARETINGESLGIALEKASRQLKELGEHSMDTVSKVVGSLKKDLASSTETVKPKLDQVAGQADKIYQVGREKGGKLWQELSKEGGYIYELSRDIGGATLATVATALGEWSQKMGGKIDEMLVYHTGEVTRGGTFKCTECSSTIKLKKAGHLPPCPKCHKTLFRRA